ncbi:MAG: PEP/pyruvate-binding domain-containing protein [Bacteroidales bacterium]|jgi:hypothetical protein
MTSNKPLDQLMLELKERAKELNCLYEVQEVLNKTVLTNEELCSELVQVIPPGWQYPEICKVKLTCFNQVFASTDFEETPWVIRSPILVQEIRSGEIAVYYTEERPLSDEGPFLKEERKLIDTIAERCSLLILHQKLKSVFNQEIVAGKDQKSEWWVILDMLKQTDPKLLIRLSRKMINYLCWTGVEEANKMLELFSPAFKSDVTMLTEVNSPYQRQADSDLLSLSYSIFELAGRYLSEREILNRIQKWTKEDRSGFLSEILENMGSSLADINTAVERYHHLAPHMLELSEPREKNFKISLIRRLLTDQPAFIDIAKNFIKIDSFYTLLQHVIYPAGSHGQLGGKSSGLFVAHHILQDAINHEDLFGKVKVPKTWYLTSDGLLSFMSYNNLEEVMEQKYKDISQVRQEYPYVVHVFKNALFPPEILKGLTMALDYFGETPLVVRSSSLLEDRVGSVFAGKYKSLFIANQGDKETRIMALLDAVAEVYASTFGPDAIDYRAENGLLDYREEMGIMIQEVVGKKTGNYFFPAFAGVAFSHNDFRWSGRIKSSDGLVRLVPGLGTRAVDRLSDDYPVLISPGQPDLRVNVTIDEIIRYSPKYMDVINLTTGKFETVEVESVLKRYGRDYPAVSRVVSILKQDYIQPARPLGMDFSRDAFVVNFEGLIKRTSFVTEIKNMLDALQKEYKHPVDIEFAHDGQDFYLLQCRSQSFGLHCKPAEIPTSLPHDQIIFSANKYVPNGIISNITHVVYVDPVQYGLLTNHSDLLQVGHAVGRLNTLLPKRQFILMGPGRWGSRGDIKLGVSITYSEIKNTAMLIEIARKTNNYMPDLSFGTHFFQDLVESNIKYLPLYPDDREVVFKEAFFLNSPNVLTMLLPDMQHLEQVIKVVDVRSVYPEKVLEILMNSDRSLAVALTVNSHETKMEEVFIEEAVKYTNNKDVHWQWRQKCVERMAQSIDPLRFGIKALYVFGSVKNGTAGPGSDIDLLIHIENTQKQQDELAAWLEGWSLSLAQVNQWRTGINTDEGLLDVHYITDEDIRKRTSFAVKIGAVTDAARPVVMGK